MISACQSASDIKGDFNKRFGTATILGISKKNSSPKIIKNGVNRVESLTI